MKVEAKTAWGFGCIVEVLLMVVIVNVLSSDQGTSLLLYMMLLALPMAGVRLLLFTDSTPAWKRVFLGPAGMVLCIGAAVLFPVHIDDAEDKAEGKASEVGHADPAPVPAPEAKETVEQVMSELDELVGLEGVKAEVHKLVNLVKVNEARRKQGLKVPPMTYHMVFTGNPGTGKTTVARLVARVFRCLGIVSKGQLVETDRSGLVAKYAGQTALKTNQLIDSAMGGVLFIDEAYQLNQGENDTYGSEAVATLLKRMEDARGSIVVIIAGYKDEMKKFMEINSGLESRFSRVVEFPDYTAKELEEIFRSMAAKGKYRLSPDVERWLEPYIAMLTKNREKTFGNARWARNLFEKSVERQALRVTAMKDPPDDELLTLRMKDLGISLKDPSASDED